MHVSRTPPQRSASQDFIRPAIRKMASYVPGEQPKVKGLVKLNTNENPYPPSRKVLAAVRKAVDGRLRLYPDPVCGALREKLAALHGCSPDNVIVGNGSDELLAMAVRCFVEPTSLSARNVHTVVQYFTPSYSLYPVLAAAQGARTDPFPLNPDFSLPSLAEMKLGKQWDFKAALTLVTTPNAPSGRGYATCDLEGLCRLQQGVVLLDEAYVDFANENALALALRHPNVLVARTFSKAYSLCFQRVGYLIGHPDLIAALNKIRDSYNVNGLGQLAAVATLNELPYYRANFQKIISARTELSSALAQLGFQVFPSQTNFILVRPPRFPARAWLEKLRNRKILVRWFADPAVEDYLRITIGTPEEVGALIKAAQLILKART